jgi:hypothetical protein
MVFITGIHYSTDDTQSSGIFIEFTFFKQQHRLRLEHIEDVEFVRQTVHAAYAQQHGLSAQTFYDTWTFLANGKKISISIIDGQSTGVLTIQSEGVENRLQLELQSNFKTVLSNVYKALSDTLDMEDQEDDDKENEE